MSFISNECFGPRTSTMTSKISTVQIKNKIIKKEKAKSKGCHDRSFEKYWEHLPFKRVVLTSLLGKRHGLKFRATSKL